MSTVINKHTFQKIESANTANYRDGNWWINPVEPDCDKRYWKRNTETDSLECHDAETRQIIDEGDLIARKHERKREVEVELNEYIERAYSDYSQRNLLLLLILANDEGNLETKAYILQLVAWIANGQQLMKEAKAKVDQSSTLSEVNAAGFDYEAFALWHQTMPDVQPMIAQELLNG